MKRLATLLLLVPVFLSCNKSDVNEITPEISYSEVPNWLETVMLADMPGGAKDTVYAYTLNDRSYIRYKGLPYHIQAQNGIVKYWVADTAHTFYITVFDGKDKPLMDCFVNPGQYRRDDRLVPQPQAFRPIQSSPFVNSRTSDYYSR